MRWYLEDYLEYPTPAAPQIAAQVESALAELGIALFRSVFSTEDARDVWGAAQHRRSFLAAVAAPVPCD